MRILSFIQFRVILFFNLAGILLSLLCTMSYAAELTVLGSINAAFPSVNSLGTSVGQSGLGGGGGFLFGHEIGPQFSLEWGGLIVSRNWGVEAYRQTETRFHLPLQIRYRMDEFDVLAGGYYSLGIGQVKANGTNTDYSALQQSSKDYGVILGVGKVIPFDSNVSFVVRAQILFGLKDVSTSPLVNIYYRDVQLLGGVVLSLF